MIMYVVHKKNTECGMIKQKPPHLEVSKRGAARISHPLLVRNQ